MDGICSAVLNKINALGTAGRYFVVSADEFFDAFPENFRRDEVELKKALKSLVSDGYIDIKYSSGNMYCVALLKTYTEEDAAPPAGDDGFNELYQTEPQKNARYPAFWAGFAGGALGSAVIGAIAWIVSLC